MRLDDVAAKLSEVAWESDSQLMARCPCHDDARSSLAVGLGRSGRVLVHCFAGCKSADILRAIGIASWKKAESSGETRSRPAQVFSASYYAPLSLRGLELTHGWDYQNADGSAAFSVYRLRRPDGGKEIRPVVPVGSGYSFGLPPAPRPLFRLPGLLKSAGLVVVTEGEKACDAVIASGWTATTSVGGASAAAKSDWSPLALRRVLVWPDNDEPGLKYAEDVRKLLEIHHCDVTVMRPVGGDGGDAADCSDPGAAILEAA